MKPSTITLFGAGNLAVHLAKALTSAGYRIAQVYSRTQESAEWLANLINAKAITRPGDFDTSSDVIIFALNDNALPETLSQLNISGQLTLHTSGSLPMDVFKGKTEHYGVLYPLQTFSKFREVKFREIPIFIEANSPNNLTNLKMFADTLTTKVYLADSLQRRQMHLSAVFANNFVNHFYALASEIAKQSGFTFDELKPLILETALKAVESDNPGIAQTGPAVRNNKGIIEKHTEMLAASPEVQKLYTFVTNSILKRYHNDTTI